MVVVAVVVVLSGSPLGVVVVSSRSDVVMAATVDRWPFGTVTVEASPSLLSFPVLRTRLEVILFT